MADQAHLISSLTGPLSSAAGGMIPKNSKQPLPPLSVPDGHVALRILCHASCVGGFIGKSGASIKNLQRRTSSKIRVADCLLSGSEDRLIVIVAATTPAKELRLVNGEKEEIYSVSPAQEAALRVFEKVLEVSSDADDKDWMGVVSCRLLVDAVQAGSVIGKGGKVVEKMRRETGAKIRVLLGQHLPPGIAPPHEVVEIGGEVLAVKKALLGVTDCLQECPVIENSIIKESKALESTAPPGVTDSCLDPLQLITASMASISSSFALEGRLDKKCSSLDLNAKQREVVFRILCSNDRVGGVIGRGGSIVRALQEKTRTSISIAPPVPNCDERLITITSMENVESMYSPAQHAVVQVFSRSVDAGAEKGLDTGSNKSSSTFARLLVQSNQVGCLLGKGGTIISEMRKATGAVIRILRGDEVPKCASEDDEVVEISGHFVKVQDAINNITSKLRSHLVANKVTNVPGSMVNTVIALDDGHHGQTTLKQGLNPLLHLHRLEHSPSQDFRISERLNGPPRTFVNLGSVASANGGLEIGRANRPAVVTNTTVEILVPESAVSSVYGENGSNLVRIRQISGAKVIFHEPHPESRDMTIIISGTPDETQAAQSLLHAFILTGPV